MAASTIEERVTRLEALVAKLAAGSTRGKKKDWRRTLGMFTGDEVMKRIDEQALRYRAADRNKSKRTRR